MQTATSSPATRRSASDVLVLDDDRFSLGLLEHMLQRLGCTRVHCRDSGPEALHWLDAAARPPGLILLDINMPGMDGLAVVRQLSSRGYRGGLVLVSGEDEQMRQATERLAQAFDLRVLGAVRKPPHPDALARLLHQWEQDQPQTRQPSKVYQLSELRQALADDQFVNHYQPKVAMGSGEVVGVEALSRWRHPVDGLVAPAQFIPVLEAHGLVGQLTAPLLRRTLTQLRAWRDRGLVLRGAINVTMEDLSRLEFADFVHAQTLAAGISPQQLVLEVTESQLMQHLTTVLEVLTRLRLKRFRLAIDDFGTGHSSLLQLCSLPADHLKIDQAFTHHASKDSRLRAIFQASLGLAQQLGMGSVAEGIETSDDWHFARRAGCDVGQGFFIARPMPAEEVPSWCAGWAHRICREGLVGAT